MKNSNKLIASSCYERIAYIDVMRGIGILFVMLGHSIVIMDNPINRTILSFHMPLFFFISGILFFGKTFDNISFCKYIKKKFQVLIIPQILQGIILVSYRFFQSAMHLVVDGETIIWSNIFNLDFFGWFLIVLFLMDIIMFFELKIFKNINIQIVITIISLVMFFGFSYINMLVGENTLEIIVFLLRTVEQLFVALFFGHLGMFSKKLIDKYLKYKKIQGVSLLVFCLVAIFSYYNQPIGMYLNEYGNKVMFLGTAILGIFATLDLSCVLENSKKIAWFGENSIIIYVTHFQILDFLNWIFPKISNLVYGEYPLYVISFLLLILLEIPIIVFANKYIPFLFGKSKKN